MYIFAQSDWTTIALIPTLMFLTFDDEDRESPTHGLSLHFLNFSLNASWRF